MEDQMYRALGNKNSRRELFGCAPPSGLPGLREVRAKME